MVYGCFNFFGSNITACTSFYPSARWAQRGIVVPFVHRRLRRRMEPSGYYINMVQQFEYIIHTNI